jgi:hypothetical protein
MQVSSPSTRIVLTVLLCTAATYASWNCITTWNQPLLEQHPFRQTQTALITYWFLREGFSLAYQTPVLGYPWSVPFEFPFYQLLVAAVTTVTGLPLGQVGRMVSFTFFLLSLLPLYQLTKALNLDVAVFLITGTLFLLSPVCLFWGRTFMIESCALFLALMFLVCFVRGMRAADTTKRWYYVLGATAFGVLGALTKVTTFAMFFLLAVGMLAYLVTRPFMASTPGSRGTVLLSLVKLHWPYVLVLMAPVITTHYWVAFTDSVKSLSPLCTWLTSTNMWEWNFGTLAQRLSVKLWHRVVWQRAVQEAIGVKPAMFLGATVLICVRRQLLALILVLVTAYIGVFLLFTNLHMVHNYYQYANAVFLIGAAAVVLYAVSTKSRLAFFALLGLVILVQVREFRGGYGEFARADLSPQNNTTLAVSEVLRTQTALDDVILVYGIDWSSEISYYSERKAITVPREWKDSSDVLRNIEKFTDGKSLGAIVVCSPFSKTEELQALLRMATAGMSQEQKANCDIHFRVKASGT